MEPHPEDMKTMRGAVDFFISGMNASVTQAALIALVCITPVMSARKLEVPGEDMMAAVVSRTGTPNHLDPRVWGQSLTVQTAIFLLDILDSFGNGLVVVNV